VIVEEEDDEEIEEDEEVEEEPIVPVTPVTTTPDGGPGTPDDSSTGAPVEEQGEPDIEYSILDNLIPLATLRGGTAWSLLNLMMSILAMFNTVLLLWTVIVRRRRQQDLNQNDMIDESRDEEGYDDYEETPEKRRRLISLKIAALLIGITPGILFLILENIRLPIVWITQWTPIIGFFFIVHMSLVLAQFVIKKRVKYFKKEDKDRKGNLIPASEGAAV